MGNIITDFGGGEQVVRMTSNGRFCRPIPAAMGTWVTLRIGLRWTAENIGVNLLNPNFWFGICSGSTAIPGDATCTHFVGATRFPADWSYAATNGGQYANATWRPGKKVGTTITQTAVNTFTVGVYVCNGFFNVFYLDITRGSPNFTVSGAIHRNIGAASGPSEATFYSQIIQPTPAITNHTAGAAGGVAVNEGTDGTLDHVCVWWDQGSTHMDIADLGLVRFA